VERLLDYLDTVDSPHEGAADLAVLQRDFKQFYSQYDVRRGKDFVSTFPELADWYRTL
jgi:predicted YcjX-like family ATPase